MAKKPKENNIFSNMEASELNSDELPSYADEVGSFPERLREIIGGQSVRSFAAKCHLSDGVVRQYLAGKSEPGLESLLAIAATANVSVDWLATGFGNKDDGRFGDQIALARKKRGENYLRRKAEEEAAKASDEGEMRRDGAKHIDPAHNSGVTQETVDFIAAIGSDKPVRVAEPGVGGFVPHLSAEVAELAVLLENYAGKALKADLKAKLIKIKDMMEG